MILDGDSPLISQSPIELNLAGETGGKFRNFFMGLGRKILSKHSLNQSTETGVDI